MSDKRIVNGYEIEPEAKLDGADLRGCDLREAKLRGCDLREAKLRRADLRGCDLRRAELSGCDLRWAELRDADLREAKLRFAELGGADLRWANLRGATGVLVLTHTQHGYTVVAVWHGDHWRIQAGCRDFTVADARAHWGADYGYQPDAERIRLMLDWLEKQPAPEEEPAPTQVEVEPDADGVRRPMGSSKRRDNGGSPYGGTRDSGGSGGGAMSKGGAVR